MSLIPSESLNFPDSFRAKEGWHLTDTMEESPENSPEGEGAGHKPVVSPVEPAKPAIDLPTPPSSMPSEPAAPTATAAPSPTAVTAEKEVDDPQLELPNSSGEGRPADSAATADLNALLGQFLSAGAVPNISVEQPNGESLLPADGIIDQKEIPPVTATTRAGATDSLPNEMAVTGRAQGESPLPTHSGPTAEIGVAAGTSPEQAILAALQSLSHMEAEPPAGTVVVETPAQAQHIMEVIAAAVQRGALRGETIPEPAPPIVTSEEPPSPTPPPFAQTVLYEEPPSQPPLPLSPIVRSEEPLFPAPPPSASTITSEEPPSQPPLPLSPIVRSEEPLFPAPPPSAPTITSEEPPLPFPPIVRSEEPIAPAPPPSAPAVTPEEPPFPQSLPVPPIVRSEEPPSPPPQPPLAQPPPRAPRLGFSISPIPMGELDAPIPRAGEVQTSPLPKIPKATSAPAPAPIPIPVSVAVPVPVKEPPVPITDAVAVHTVPDTPKAPVTAKPAVSAPLPAQLVEPAVAATPVVVVQTASVEEIPKAPSTAAPLGTSSDVPRAPAKIRITPRKIKPRPQLEPVPEGPATLQPLDYAYQGHVPREATINVVHDEETEQDATFETRSQVAEPIRAEPLPPRPELSARKIAATRLELAQADRFLPTAKERRSRLIGFGICELAVVAALVLLARFGFTHHFPDSTIKILVFILIFAAAGVAIALPIVFLRNDPRRWERASQ